MSDNQLLVWEVWMRRLFVGLSLAIVVGSAAAAQQGSNALTRMHDDLKLTSAQEPAWQQYMAVMASGAQLQSRHMSMQRMLPQLQTPRRLALLEASMSQDLMDFRHQSEAIRAFYDALTPTQQQAFDHDTAPGAGSDQQPH
jgi:protein CpxP